MSEAPAGTYRYDAAYFDGYHQVPAYRLKYPDENVVRFLASSFGSDDRPNSKALDLGCGCGRHLALLGEMGFQPYGIDGSSWAINYSAEFLKERGLDADLLVGSIIELPYEDNYFDAIIEHATLVNNSWEDILAASAECHRVLRDGGVGFFLFKTRRDCAFDDATEVAHNTFLVDEGVYMSHTARKEHSKQIFRAFDEADINQMFSKFSKVRIHTWDLSFKNLDINAKPGERLTSYWIVLVQK